MICKQCGTENPDDSIFCELCGKRIVIPKDDAISGADEKAEKPDQSARIVDVLLSYLRENGYEYDLTVKNHIMFKARTKNSWNPLMKRLRFHFLIDDDGLYYLSVASVDMKVSETDRREMAEYLTRINFGQPFGSFEMDMRSGRVQFKYSVLCGEMVPGTETIEFSIRWPVFMLECYGDAMLEVMLGKESAKTAAAKGKKSPQVWGNI